MLPNAYLKNGLVFWTEAEIELRDTFVGFFSRELRLSLLRRNPAFQFVRVEAPLLTPAAFINPNYTDDDIFKIDDLVLRPETTMGSYAAAKHLLSGFYEIKYRPPVVVWQHGKSFRNEQDQPTKFLRLKEFHQLEFQILFAQNTADDYYPQIVTDVERLLAMAIGRPMYAIPSDRLPSYSTETTDIMVGDPAGQNMEMCSISRRTDYGILKNIEVAIGTDRCIYQWSSADKVF